MHLLIRQAKFPEAFTLLELLVTVTVFAIILAAINSVFFYALRLRNKSSEMIKSVQPAERALDILKMDFGGITQTGILSGPVASDTTVQGLSQPVALEFYTSTGVVNDNDPWGDLVRIDYWLQAPTNNTMLGGRDLIRGVTRNLLAPIALPPEAHPLLQGVQNLKFSYFDGTNWLDNWDETINLSNNPVAIKMQIDFVAPKNGGVAPPPLKMVMPIITQLRTNNTVVAATATSGGGGGGGGGGNPGGGGTGREVPKGR